MLISTSPPYGQRRYQSFELKLDFPLQTAQEKNAQFDGLLDRSYLKRFAIQTRYWVAVNLEKHVDTDRVVSAQGEWLFYKPQFWGQNCENHLSKRRLGSVAHARLLNSLLTHVDRKITFTVSPDKASAMQEKLTSLITTNFPCKKPESEKWRGYNVALGTPIIDHLDAVNVAKHNIDDVYFKTDTQCLSICLRRSCGVYWL